MERLAGCVFPSRPPSVSLVIVITIVLFPSSFFDFLLFDFESIVRTDLPEGRCETLCVAGVAEEVGDSFARPEQEGDRG
jgi:hypothetical protein